MFADDTMLFFKASADQAVRVKQVLDVYEKGTGQLINPAKCSVLFSSVCTQEAAHRKPRTWFVQRYMSSNRLSRINIWDYLLLRVE
jgi:hypothetical protein